MVSWPGSDLGALLCFDMNNIRYLTATQIGTWAYDKLIRFRCCPRGAEPSYAGLRIGLPATTSYCPWLAEAGSRAGPLQSGALDVPEARPASGRCAEDQGRATSWLARTLESIVASVLFALQDAAQ